jgi:hypothetical protein
MKQRPMASIISTLLAVSFFEALIAPAPSRMRRLKIRNTEGDSQ